METVEMHCTHTDCVYRGKGPTKTCDYILIAHQPRSCPISNCDKYRPGRRRRGMQRRFEFNYGIED